MTEPKDLSVVAEHVPRGTCAACKQPIPFYVECVGGVGFVSPISDDLPGSVTLTQVKGFAAIGGVERVVCMKCYVDEFKQKYPGSPCHLEEKAAFIHEDLGRAERFGLVRTTPEPQQAAVGMVTEG